ncbi:hypothetical protein MRX96_056804 [Rhipicephalus microplus]
MSIMSYNGGVVVAMKGKECVAIAADRRLGTRGHTISLVFKRIFEMGPEALLRPAGPCNGHEDGGTEAQLPQTPSRVRGGVVHIIEKDKVTTKHLKTRMD